MTLHYKLKDIPNNRITLIDYLLCRFHSLDNTALDEFTDNEWLVQLSCHKLWQTAFVHLQFWTNDDNRTCRIIDTFTEEVLTETTLLTLKRVRKRLQWSI